MAVPATSVGRVLRFWDDLVACHAYVSLAVQLHRHIFCLQCDYLLLARRVFAPLLSWLLPHLT